MSKSLSCLFPCSFLPAKLSNRRVCLQQTGKQTAQTGGMAEESEASFCLHAQLKYTTSPPQSQPQGRKDSASICQRAHRSTACLQPPRVQEKDSCYSDGIKLSRVLKRTDREGTRSGLRPQVGHTLMREAGLQTGQEWGWVSASRNKTHGVRRTQERGTWQPMRDRSGEGSRGQLYRSRETPAAFEDGHAMRELGGRCPWDTWVWPQLSACR